MPVKPVPFIDRRRGNTLSSSPVDRSPVSLSFPKYVAKTKQLIFPCTSCLAVIFMQLSGLTLATGIQHNILYLFEMYGANVLYTCTQWQCQIRHTDVDRFLEFDIGKIIEKIKTPQQVKSIQHGACVYCSTYILIIVYYLNITQYRIGIILYITYIVPNEIKCQ